MVPLASLLRHTAPQIKDTRRYAGCRANTSGQNSPTSHETVHTSPQMPLRLVKISRSIWL